MKKTLLICFLASLCLYGSTLTAQVADSPGADFLHRSRPSVSFGLGDTHRGGEIRSDTLPEQNGLVDHSVAKGQEGDSSSAQPGALIYGEIINPDSLGPLRLVVSPFSQALGNSLPDTSLEINTTYGTMLDGVIDPRVRKFRAKLPETSEINYLSLYLGNRLFIQDFLVSPTDSIQLSLDLQHATLVFGGPQGEWMETQYLVHRAVKQDHFIQPRNLVEMDREKYFDTQDYRSQWEQSTQEFGARLQVLELLKDHVDYEVQKLTRPIENIPGYRVLESRKGYLTSVQYNQMKADLLGRYYAEAISTLRRFGYSVAKAHQNSQAVSRIEGLMPEILSRLKVQMGQLENEELTGGEIYFYKEWASFQAALTEQDYRDLVAREFQKKTKNTLLYVYAMERVSSQEDPVLFLAETVGAMGASSYRSELEAMQTRLSPNQPIRFAEFTSLDGAHFDTEDLKGKPTLLYFYFSTCTHSAHFFQEVLKPIEQDGLDDLQLVAISVDNDPGLWKSQLTTYSDPKLTNWLLPRNDWRGWLDHYLITGYPRTMLLDAEGNILSIWVKGRTESSFRSNLDSLLNPKDSIPDNVKP